MNQYAFFIWQENIFDLQNEILKEMTISLNTIGITIYKNYFIETIIEITDHIGCSMNF